MEHEDVKKQEAFRKTRFLEDQLQTTQKVNIFAIKKKKMSLSLILAAIRSSVLLNIKHIPLYNPALNSLKKKKNPISLPW